MLRVGDANDVDRIESSLEIFQKTAGRPTFIILDSHIGYGAPHKQDTAAAHGEPLGDEEVRLCKRFYGWPEEAQFLVPEGVQEHFAAGIGAQEGRRPAAGGPNFSEPTGASTRNSPPRSTRCSATNCPPDGTGTFPCFRLIPQGIAGREASGKVLNVLAQS